MKLGALLLACLGASAASASEASRQLLAARNALSSAQYQLAAQLAAQGLQAGDGEPDEVWALHALSAEVTAVIGDPAAAVRAFSTVLSLRPDYRPPAGASPRIIEPFTQALARTPLPLHPKVSLRRTELHQLAVAVELQDDGLGLVQGARVSGADVASTGLRRTTSQPTRYEGAVTCAAPCEVRVELVDEWGNSLARVPLAESSVLPPLASVGQAAQPAPKLTQRPGVYLALTSAAILAASVYFGARAQNEQRALEDINARRSESLYSDALSLDRARYRHQTFLWLGLGGAALTGVGAVWLW